MNYYNENNEFAAEWLRRLIARKLIPEGIVDTRSIADVKPIDLEPFTQCHFFAGIGGWSRALALANFPIDQPVWTGSCPCQPFSQAGESGGFDDARHLWPAWNYLISQCKPPIIFGEQVASPAGLVWLDLVYDDLEAQGYTVGSSDLCAASVGMPHIRQRLWFSGSRLDNTDRARLQGQLSSAHSGRPDATSGVSYVPFNDSCVRPIQSGVSPLGDGFSFRVGRISGYGNAIVPMVGAEFIRASI